MSDDGRQIQRRMVLAMLGASTVVIACGGTSAVKSGATDTPAPGTSGSAAQPTVTIGGPAVDAARRFGDADVALAKSHYGGVWLGSWVDDKGGTGTVDATIDVDTAARTLTVTTRFGGALVGGSPLPATTHKISIDSFSSDADTLSLVSPQIGSVTVDPVAFKLTCSAIPGHDDIDSLALSATVSGTTAICAYTVTKTDTTKSRGAFAWARGAVRPAAPAIGDTGSKTDFVQGIYAAGLVTTAELTAAFGRTANPATGNGGRDNYQPGIGTSNARAASADGALVLQFTIYRSTDAATAKTFYGLNSPVAQALTGIGDAAQLITSVSHVQVLRGREVLDLSVIDTTNAMPGDRLLAMAKQIAGAIAPRMSQ